jgi:rhamnosyltransferase
MNGRISVVVPSCNGAATLPPLLDALDVQRRRSGIEVLAVDSGSTDGTRELLRRRADTLIDIEPAAFDHGMTRNLAVSAASGELVVLIVQDAVPADDGWLDALAAPFDRDERLAGAFARQVARPDASPVTRHYHGRWAGASAVARVTTIGGGPGEFRQLSPMARFERCIFDNVCSCIRKSVWQQHPFRATPIAEDVIWAKEVLLAGFSLAYVPDATVVHSHERSAVYELRRTRLLHRVLHEQFELRTIPTVTSLARSVASSIAVHARCEREAGAVVPSARALALAVAWPLGQFLGGNDSVAGRPLRRWKGI